jgi:polar amino acid transport system substrate-binding protein
MLALNKFHIGFIFFMLTFLIFLFFHSNQMHAQIRPVYHAVVVSTLPPPLLIYQDGRTDGIVKDYIDALGSAMDVTISLDVLPRLRIDSYSSEDNYDLNCYTNRTWNDKPELFFWTKPLFFKKEIIIGSIPLPKSVNEFKGEAIGTLLGYKYPSLDEAFKMNKLKREDTVNEESNFLKLIKGRNTLIITEDIILSYYRKTHPGLTSKLFRTQIVEAEYPIQCALNRKSKLSLSSLNKAIDALIESRKIELIFSKYK